MELWFRRKIDTLERSVQQHTTTTTEALATAGSEITPRAIASPWIERAINCEITSLWRRNAPTWQHFFHICLGPMMYTTERYVAATGFSPCVFARGSTTPRSYQRSCRCLIIYQLSVGTRVQGLVCFTKHVFSYVSFGFLSHLKRGCPGSKSTDGLVSRYTSLRIFLALVASRFERSVRRSATRGSETRSRFECMTP